LARRIAGVEPADAGSAAESYPAGSSKPEPLGESRAEPVQSVTLDDPADPPATAGYPEVDLAEAMHRGGDQ
jgi:hypothetical protein